MNKIVKVDIPTRTSSALHSSESKQVFSKDSNVTPCLISKAPSWRDYITALWRPMSADKKQQLKARWDALPKSLQLPNQIVGQHWVHCGYTLGPSYCSFGCSHCYLPKGANKVPLVPLAQMKAQIDAQRSLLGEGGNLQITGGDVVDAYFKAGRPDELITVLQYATLRGLVPMLMTHGQILLEQPDYFTRLVSEGGLRKLSIHIDIIMAGRKGFPVKQLQNEAQLNTLRDQFVDLVLKVRKQTGKLVVAAQTVTVGEKNIDSIGEIIHWLMEKKQNMDVCRTISFQTEADVGRTLYSDQPVTPERVWQQLSDSVGKPLPRDHMVFGHPDCSSVASILVRPHPRKQEVINLSLATDSSRKMWNALLHTFGGLGAKSTHPGLSLLQKIGGLLRRPAAVYWVVANSIDMLRRNELSWGFLRSALGGQVCGFNLVMHNFMSEQDVASPRSNTIQDRLQACAFKGVVQHDGQWQAVSMCEMNAQWRPELYREQLSAKKQA